MPYHGLLLAGRAAGEKKKKKKKKKKARASVEGHGALLGDTCGQRVGGGGAAAPDGAHGRHCRRAADGAHVLQDTNVFGRSF